MTPFERGVFTGLGLVISVAAGLAIPALWEIIEALNRIASRL